MLLAKLKYKLCNECRTHREMLSVIKALTAEVFRLRANIKNKLEVLLISAN